MCCCWHTVASHRLCRCGYCFNRAAISADVNTHNPEPFPDSPRGLSRVRSLPPVFCMCCDVGKSTMADLMVRYLDPDEGKITIDGRDIRELKLHDLRREVILLDQSPYLFNDTIAANISFAMPDAPRSAIEEAARAASSFRQKERG